MKENQLLKYEKTEKMPEFLMKENIGYSRGLIVDFMKKHHTAPVEYDELVSAASLGLCEAAHSYRNNPKTSFKTFSYFRIRGAMFDLLRYHDDTARYYYHLKKKESKEWKIQAEKKIALDKEKAIKSEDEISKKNEIEEKFKIEEDEFCLLQPKYFQKVSLKDLLSSLINSQDNFPYHAVHTYKSQPIELIYKNDPSPEEKMDQKILRQKIYKCLKCLSALERKVIKAIYFEDKKRKDICEEIEGLALSTLGRVHRRALCKLKFIFEKEQLKAESQKEMAC